MVGRDGYSHAVHTRAAERRRSSWSMRRLTKSRKIGSEGPCDDAATHTHTHTEKHRGNDFGPATSFSKSPKPHWIRIIYPSRSLGEAHGGPRCPSEGLGIHGMTSIMSGGYVEQFSTMITSQSVLAWQCPIRRYPATRASREVEIVVYCFLSSARKSTREKKKRKNSVCLACPVLDLCP